LSANKYDTHYEPNVVQHGKHNNQYNPTISEA